jgi:hypothetical protein
MPSLSRAGAGSALGRTRRWFRGIFCAWACVQAHAQSADWQEVVWREPQVRYLLADLTLNGGKSELYRKYAAEERDPDSREAIRLWDLGARVVNTNDFERRWVTNRYGKDGRVMRVVFRGTERTIQGTEALLTSDFAFRQASLRIALAELTLGRPPATLESARGDTNVAEALRRWAAGVRVVNAGQMEVRGQGAERRLFFQDSGYAFDPAWIRLNTDVPYPETNVRYFMADIALGGSLEFYRAAAERDHELGCREAVRRTEEGYRITNLAEFERQRVDGRVLITRQGSDVRISGLQVRLSSDLP